MLPVLALALAALILAPLGAQAADLVVWWEKGFYPEEDEAVREIIAAFEQETGKQVELVFHPQAELPARSWRRSRPASPPDFAFGFWLATYIPKWALEDRLVDLTDAVGHFSDLFDPNQLDRAMLLNARTGQQALYGLPMGQISNHVHVWKSLLEQRGLLARRHPQGVGAVLVVLVRPGPAGGAQGIGPRRHLGHRPAHVGRGRRHRRPVLPVRRVPTMRTT